MPYAKQRLPLPSKARNSPCGGRQSSLHTQETHQFFLNMTCSSIAVTHHSPAPTRTSQHLLPRPKVHTTCTPHSVPSLINPAWHPEADQAPGPKPGRSPCPLWDSPQPTCVLGGNGGEKCLARSCCARGERVKYSKARLLINLGRI